MNGFPDGLIKICGIRRPDDAAVCLEAGVDCVGFIFHPSSPRFLQPQEAAGIDTGRAKRVGVFVKQGSDEVLRIMDQAKLDLAQLHGGQSPEFIELIGPERVISVQWPEKHNRPDDFAQALRLVSRAAFHLFDAGDGGGGHGRAFELERLKLVQTPRPWLLAGGLDAERVDQFSVEDCPGLIGFDFNSGLEDEPGRKNKSKIEAAVKAARLFFKKRWGGGQSRHQAELDG